jgi:D-glycero-alpha-D-manno-heptose-7-phosphate kinase
LFHEGAQTLNAAISLRARCSIRPLGNRRLVINSHDAGQTVDVAHWSELRDNHELRLLGRLLHYFQAEGLELHTRSESPVGAGIAGSSAMNIAVCGALAAWSGRQLSHDELMQIAMNVEAQAIEVPTGVQDYRPALYGGVSAVELRVDGIRRVALPVDASELQRRLILAYTGATRNSGINNWDVTKRHIDGDARVRRSFDRICEIALEMRQALERGDWGAFGALVEQEWSNRKQLAPAMTTPTIDRLLDAARAAGARSGKICGAGGGGCLLCVADPHASAAVRSALSRAGAQVLDFQIESKGLLVESRVTA